MDWQEIEGLYKEGYNVESHTMNHNALSNMHANVLNLDIGQSKQCLFDHGINATIFAYRSKVYADLGSDNSTIVNVIAK